VRTLHLHVPLAIGVWGLNALVLAQQPTVDPPPEAVTEFRLGEEALRKEAFDQAERHFRTAIAHDAGFVKAHCALGQVHMATRRYRPAVDALSRCKFLITSRAADQAAATATDDLERRREVEELQDAIQRARSGQIKSADAHTILKLEEQLRRIEEGRSRAGGQAAGVPAELSFALGTAHLRIGDLEEAERELREALSVRPDLGEAHNNLAAVYVGLGRWQEAQEQVAAAESAGFPVSAELKRDVAERRLGARQPDVSRKAPDAVPQEQPLSIEHTPIACVPSGRYPRIEAALTPSSRIASAKVYFRTEKSGWYAVGLWPTEDGYEAILPRPSSARSFTYYLEVTSDAAAVARTSDHVTPVTPRDQPCASTAFTTIASGLLVEPPVGRKAALVPAGFSSRGVVGHIGQFEMSAPLALGAAGVLGGLGVAAVNAKSSEEFAGVPAVGEPFVSGPGIAFVASDPPPGSMLSPGGSLALQLRVFSPSDVPGAQVTASLYGQRLVSSACLMFQAALNLSGGRSDVVTVAGRVQRQYGSCGSGNDLIDELRVAVTDSTTRPLFETGQAGIPHIRVSYEILP
jgi:tetratricopeptide (TPR) repeat protein